jgi:hypothetical protein
MSAPIYISDGDFSAANQIRDWEFEFPFTDQGDPKSFVARRLMRIESQYVRPVAFMSRRTFDSMGYAYLVSTTPAKAVDAQSRIVEYEEVWASVPNRRQIYQTVSYTEQPGYFTDGPEIVEITKSKNARVVYEYALAPLAQLLAPRLIIIGGTLYSWAGWRFGMTEALADDSENTIYLGGIYQRKSAYVTLSAFKEITV